MRSGVRGSSILEASRGHRGRAQIMTIKNLVIILDCDTRGTKLVYDFRSKFTQISTQNGNTVWSGRLVDLKEDELQFEVIPMILEDE